MEVFDGRELNPKWYVRQFREGELTTASLMQVTVCFLLGSCTVPVPICISLLRTFSKIAEPISALLGRRSKICQPLCAMMRMRLRRIEAPPGQVRDVLVAQDIHL